MNEWTNQPTNPPMNEWIKQSLIRSLWCNTLSFMSGVTSHKMTHQPGSYSDWVCSQLDILATARTTNLKAIYLFEKGASTSGTSLVGELILTITHPLTSSRPSRHSRSLSSSWILSFWNVSSILRESWTRGEQSKQAIQRTNLKQVHVAQSAGMRTWVTFGVDFTAYRMRKNCEFVLTNR